MSTHECSNLYLGLLIMNNQKAIKIENPLLTGQDTGN